MIKNPPTCHSNGTEWKHIWSNGSMPVPFIQHLLTYGSYNDHTCHCRQQELIRQQITQPCNSSKTLKNSKTKKNANNGLLVVYQFKLITLCKHSFTSQPWFVWICFQDSYLDCCNNIIWHCQLYGFTMTNELFVNSKISIGQFVSQQTTHMIQ